MAKDRDTLVGMGFDPARVDWALKATGNRGLQPAMDHILEHDGEEIPDLSSSGASAQPAGAGGDDDDDDEISSGVLANEGLEAKSIKCSECGKVFKNTALANFHAEKSGHDQFEESTEEIKPLTEEERQQKLEELRAKMAEKRAQKSVEEAKETKENEILRRKANKEQGKIKEELLAKQAIKEAEQKIREKKEDAKARAAIKAQIEADKKARAEKAAREKALRDGTVHTDTSVSVPTPAAAAAAATASTGSGVAGKDFATTRLQIRLAAGGQPLTTTLSSDAPLREVAEFLAGQSLQFDVDTVSLSQHFPRKQFSRSDMEKSLRELGLTPSAVLIAQ